MIAPQTILSRLALAGAVVVCLGAALALRAQAPQQPAAARQPSEAPAAPRFAWVDVFVDSGDLPLAAWQFEFKADQADVRIVGIEGGDHPAYKEPPYYDPHALTQNRVIVAAFSTAGDLPAGKTRVARLHLRIAGAAPNYSAVLMAAAAPDGRKISATATVQEGVGQ